MAESLQPAKIYTHLMSRDGGGEIEPVTTETAEEGMAGEVLMALTGTKDYLIRYDSDADKENPGTSVVHTEIRVLNEGKRVMLTRTGAVQWRVVFEEGMRAKTVYTVPYGSIEMDVVCDSVTWRHTAGNKNAALEIQYGMYAMGSLMTEDRLLVRVVTE